MILISLAVGFTSNGRHSSSISRLLPPALAGPPAPASRGRLCCRGGLTAPTTPTAGQAIPPLHSPTTPVILQRRQRSRTSEPSYSSPRVHPLSRRPLPRPRRRPPPWCSRRGVVNVVTTDFHPKNTVRGEADSWVHGSRKEVPPYYAENNYSSTSQQGPTILLV